MRAEAAEQYNRALKAGQKYYKTAVSRGEYPYPPALDEIVGSAAAGCVDLGLVNIPSELIAGTKTAGRVSALAGNFMPLLDRKSEFAAKWIALCDAQLGEEGIRDPIRCYEYMRRFYVQEGNKRASVLLSFGAPTIPGIVTRVLPRWSDDLPTRLYYEFLWFYERSGLYSVEFRRPGGYEKLQAALGHDGGHVWTEEERRGFVTGFARFTGAFDRVKKPGTEISPAEALLAWLELFPLAELKSRPLPELEKTLAGLWPDIESRNSPDAIELRTAPEEKPKGFVSKLFGAARAEHLNVAYIYAYDPAESVWTEAHDLGRRYVEERLGERVSVKIYRAYDRDYDAALENAAEDGAELIFATTPSMIGACRKTAALHGDVKILNCGLSQPYRGVRMYYSRIYECKYITGAIAGAMAEGEPVGYIANYPIVGTPAEINAFALGARMTNPKARVKLVWSCTPGDPLRELREQGAGVISNRVAADPCAYRALEWGIYRLGAGGALTPLAVPYWNWGRMYEQIILSVFSGAWEKIAGSRAINYWWGFDSGVLDVRFNETLPDGVCSLGWILKEGLVNGSVTPFQSRIADQGGRLRNDGSRPFAPEEIMGMDWLCDNVDGKIPDFESLLPMSRETARLLGLRREGSPFSFSFSAESGGKPSR